jgi:uncharacterized integral membrane protein
VTVPTPAWKTRRFRIAVVFGLIGVIALVLILQNFDTTEVQLLFWRAEAPLAGVIFTSMLVGAGLEVGIRALLRRRKRKRQAAQTTVTPRDEPADGR